MAVITILAGLLLSSLATAKSKAKGIACVSNLHQQGVAVTLFLTDNLAYPRIGQWPDALNTYLTQPVKTSNHFSYLSGGCWTCPADRNPQAPVQTSYGYNFAGIVPNFEPPDLWLGLGGRGAWVNGYDVSKAVIEDTVVAPGSMICTGDGFFGYRNGKISVSSPWLSRSALPQKDPGLTNQTLLAMTRHSGRVHLSFSDAHVAAQRIKSTFFDTNTTDLIQWNFDHLPHLEYLQR